MRSRRVRLFVILLVFSALLPVDSASLPSLAGSMPGHKTAAEVGFGLFCNNVCSKVSAILGPNDIQHAFIFPAPAASEAEMQRFIAAHPDNTDWHFINLPLKTWYAPSGRFARLNDVVQTINVCIDVLEGQSTAMRQPHVLHWLVPLVGRIHQTLHVGCGNYRFDANGKVALLKTLAEAAGKKHDRGCNELHYTKTGKLHSVWNDALINRTDSSTGDANLLAVIRSRIKPSTFQTTGPIRTWVAIDAKAILPEPRSVKKATSC